MPNFQFQKLDVNTPGSLTLTGQNAGRLNLRSKSLEVRTTLKSLLTVNEKYYIGFVQVCTSNSQVNHYGANVEQRWEFNQPVLSDSAAQAERPWYGSRNEHVIGGLRRLLLSGPMNAMASKQFNMSDHFEPGIAKFETLANNAAGPNQLTRVTRNQGFRLWFVAVEQSKDQQVNQYTRFAQVDWSYQYDVTVNHNGANAAIVVNTDVLTHRVTQGGPTMDALPQAAFVAPIANNNQQLSRYVNGQLANVIVARTA